MSLNRLLRRVLRLAGLRCAVYGLTAAWAPSLPAIQLAPLTTTNSVTGEVTAEFHAASPTSMNQEWPGNSGKPNETAGRLWRKLENELKDDLRYGIPQLWGELKEGLNTVSMGGTVLAEPPSLVLFGAGLVLLLCILAKLRSPTS